MRLLSTRPLFDIINSFSISLSGGQIFVVQNETMYNVLLNMFNMEKPKQDMFDKKYINIIPFNDFINTNTFISARVYISLKNNEDINNISLLSTVFDLNGSH